MTREARRCVLSVTIWSSLLPSAHVRTLSVSMPTSRPVLTQHGAFVMSGVTP